MNTKWLIVLMTVVGIISAGIGARVTRTMQDLELLVPNATAYSGSCQGLVCEIYFSQSIEAPEEYTKLVKLIETAPKEAVINLHLMGTGGMTDSAYYLYNAVSLSKAEVNTIIDGPVYSAHAYIAMVGKHITIAPGVFFMFHEPAIASNVTHENELIIAQCKELVGRKDRGLDARQKCVHQVAAYQLIVDNYFKTKVFPYMTKQETKDLTRGDDIYISGAEMQRRINGK